MGADVMRWQYCAQPPDRNLLFGFGPAHEIKRKLLTFWNSVDVPRRLREHRGLRAVAGTDLEPDRRADGRSTAGSSSGRSSSSREATAALRGDADRRRDPRVRGVRRRRLELVHPPLAAPLLLVRRGGVPDALVRARAVAARDRAGDAVPRRPPLAEPRARTGRRRCTWRRWPEAASAGPALLAEIAEVRRVVELGRQARSASQLKLRQPLRRLVVAGAPLAAGHADEIADELRVKEVEFGEVEASELRVKPNLPVLGPKLGAALREVRERLQRGRVRRARRTAASRSTATCSSRTRCSSSASAARAGRSRARTASPSRSTRRSTTSSCSRRSCSTACTR